MFYFLSWVLVTWEGEAAAERGNDLGATHTWPLSM